MFGGFSVSGPLGAKMNYIPFILFTVLTNAAAQLMLKQGMLSLGPLKWPAKTSS